ncbi:Protein kinase [Coemansia spiralis]|uniref:non-specific serine/threonine protein kinase n=2 Tax=Coemansia TaxID=4863 RepID=A0A9W8G0E3_9FUNG|nr:Protein kinase [Coemansia umbellata]KAJ2624259.1 Protein kinase [Coemansia sp. RSA 1358]KAJ2674194.1 Protein kinase [Coemansia spiralis]
MSSGKQKIGNYTVLQTLGVGSFGKVKLAVHSQTGHKVALKIIGRSKLAHSDMVGRVNREIQYLKMLRHPHIIKLYEVITTSTDIIMVIEYAGGELFNYIVERGRMNERDARRFFQQIVSAVEYCHRRNIVHRDLKPENVLLDPYDNVKVADFGLSNIMKDGEFLQTSCGSPNYAAPEVINGKLYAGPEVDAWSCGVILYVMLCGRLPFDDDHIPALFKKITAGVFTMPGYLSQGARAVLSGLLQVDPLKRMTLSQVRQQPWFTTDLPEYLKPLPESTDIEGLANLDESILSELERQLEMDRKSLVLQLRQRGTNTAKVAYQLTLDNRHMLEQSRNSNKQGIRNFALASSPPAAFQLGSMHDSRDRMTGIISGTPVSSSPLAGRNNASAGNSDNEDDEHAPSSIAILSSSLPRSAGHTLESQMYKMRLRGPNANINNPGAAPRVSSPLATPASQQGSQAAHKPIPLPGKPDITKLGSPAVAQQAASNSAGTSPSHTPSNYFRVSLPPLAGTPKSVNNSPSSSIASLAHASLKAQPANANPYSHRNDSGSGGDMYATGSSASGSVSGGGGGAEPSPLAHEANLDDKGDVQMKDVSADESTEGTAGAQRKPTVMRKRAKLTRTRWHFGIRSRSPPADVMAEVYRALRQLNMTWKHFNPYHLRAKYVPPTGSDMAQLAGEEEVKIDLQLYKLDSRDNYLVDFKAVIPQQRGSEELGDGPGASAYRAGENMLISPLPPFIQAARRRLSAAAAAGRPGMAGSYHLRSMSGDGSQMAVDSDGAEPRSLNDQFLDSNYPIQIPAELPVSVNSPINAANDRSDALPEPDALPARTVQRRLGTDDEAGSLPLSHTLDGGSGLGFDGSISSRNQGGQQQDGGGSSDSMSMMSAISTQQQSQNNNQTAFTAGGGGGIPIPGSMSLQSARAMDIPNSSGRMGAAAGNGGGSLGAAVVGSLGSNQGGGHFVGGTPRSQGRAPGSYMPGSVVGRVSLARADVSLTADGVGAGNGANRQSQERVINIFPFFDVCCKLITELAVPSTSVEAVVTKAGGSVN